ncbi:hypothetical protein GX586_13280 [bacterium]|nr:hypothetical protein [bacterium]
MDHAGRRLTVFGPIPAVLAAACMAQAAGFIWWEGEHPARTSFPRQKTSFSPASDAEKSVLSGGDWLSNEGAWRPGLFAEYEIDVPEAGEYTLYARKFWKHGPFRWRVGTGAWHSVTRDVAMLDSVSLRPLVGANWIRAGALPLSPGAHVVRIELTEDRGGTAAFDAFLLTREPFVPQGKLKPGEKTGRAGPGMWAFEPDPDRCDPAALLDLRCLNEQTAGQSGFVRPSDDGNDFVLGDGRPVKFWCVNTFAYHHEDMASLRAHARFLAKRGVNLVKFHDYPYPRGTNAAVTDVDMQVVRWCWRLVAAMKEQGIYTLIEPYWSHDIKNVPASWGVAGWPEKEPPYALLFFDQELQKGYKAWMRALFAQTNTFTGIPLAHDPAVACIDMQTEDSMLFFTMERVQGEQRARLRRRYAAWLEKQYGSLAAATAAWDGVTHEADNLPRGELGLYGVWHFTRAAVPYAKGAIQKRISDQLRFYAETMRAFNADMMKFYRDELGSKSLIIAGNWKTADNAVLYDAERWSYTPGDAVAVQRYTGPIHVNPTTPARASFSVNPGDCVAEHSVLKDPADLPIAIKQVAGKGSMNSESTWVSPTRYQSEGPFLIAVYGSLCGIDGYTFFATSSAQYDQEMGKFQVANPALLGTFPAAALLYRKGYVREAAPCVIEHRTLDSIWRRDLPLIAEGGGFDPNRDAGDKGAKADESTAVHPLAFLVGPVHTSYGGPARSNVVSDLSRYIHLDARRVESSTGEVELDYGRGICRLDTQKAQGVCGFLSAIPRHELSTVSIACSNDYATIIAVALDDQPLSSSSNVLVQVGTVCRPYGWRTEPAEFAGKAKGVTYRGERILSIGGPPWNVEKAEVTVTISNRCVRTATRLDSNGMPAGTIMVSRTGGVLSFRFPPDALYAVMAAEE